MMMITITIIIITITTIIIIIIIIIIISLRPGNTGLMSSGVSIKILVCRHLKPNPQLL